MPALAAIALGFRLGCMAKKRQKPKPIGPNRLRIITRAIIFSLRSPAGLLEFPV
jgi:hypothetical protein